MVDFDVGRHLHVMRRRHLQNKEKQDFENLEKKTAR